MRDCRSSLSVQRTGYVPGSPVRLGAPPPQSLVNGLLPDRAPECRQGRQPRGGTAGTTRRAGSEPQRRAGVVSGPPKGADTAGPVAASRAEKAVEMVIGLGFPLSSRRLARVRLTGFPLPRFQPHACARLAPEPKGLGPGSPPRARPGRATRRRAASESGTARPPCRT